MKLISLFAATVLAYPTAKYNEVDDECLAKCKRLLDHQYNECTAKPEDEQSQCFTMLAVAVGQCLKNQC